MRFFLTQTEGNVLRGQVVDQQALEMLRRYLWPGNIRELRYFIHRLCAAMPDTLDAATIEAELLMPFDCRQQPCPSFDVGAASPDLSDPDFARQGDSSATAPGDPGDDDKDGKGERGERERIQHALHACRGHQGKAAFMLHMSRSTLFRKMRRLGMR